MASFYPKSLRKFEKTENRRRPLKALGIQTIQLKPMPTHGIAKQGAAYESQKVQARYGAILEATQRPRIGRTMDSPTNKN
jgi:hypothetical protein